MIGQAPFDKVQPVNRKHKKHSAFQFLKSKDQTKMVSLPLMKDGRSADKEAVRYYLTDSDKGESKRETEGGIVDKQVFGPEGPVSRNNGATRVVEQSSDQEEQCPPDSDVLNRDDSKDDMDKSPSKIAPTIPDSPIPFEGDAVSDIDEHDSPRPIKDDNSYESYQRDNSPAESLESIPDSPNPSTIHMDMGDRNDENATDDASRSSYDSNASCQNNAAFIDEN